MKKDKKALDQKETYSIMIYLGLITQLAVSMLTSIFGLFFLGHWLGGKFDYPMAFGLTGLLLGIFLGFYLCFKQIKDTDKLGRKK